MLTVCWLLSVYRSPTPDTFLGLALCPKRLLALGFLLTLVALEDQRAGRKRGHRPIYPTMPPCWIMVFTVAVFLFTSFPNSALPGRVRPGPLASTGLHVLLLVPGLHHSLWGS